MNCVWELIKKVYIGRSSIPESLGLFSTKEKANEIYDVLYRRVD